jgi:hypothetical protein
VAVVSTLHIPEIDPEDDVLSAAFKYADAGWYVLPVKMSTKHPGSVVGTHWQDQSSRDPKVLASWYAGTSGLGIALHQGRSGAVAVDVDNPEAMPDVLAAACVHTVHQSTRTNVPHRGHYLFAMPPGRNIGNSNGQLGKAWGEIRGKNGVVIVEPSHHEKAADGGRYQWVTTGELLALPGDIAALLPDAADATDAATDAQVTTFLAEHTTASRPELVNVWCSMFAKDVDAGASRHLSMNSKLTGAMKEARAGLIDANAAADTLEAMFLTAVAREPKGKQGNARSGAFARNEWAGLLSWAVAQALVADLDEVRARVADKVPERKRVDPMTNLRQLREPADIADVFAPRHPQLTAAALQGLPGRVVLALDPYTEADRAAVLVTFLSAAGAMIGNSPHVFAGDVEHPCRLWPLVIGPTAGGMKGTSWAAVRRIIERASGLHPVRVDSGLSSAEGLVEAVVDSHGQPDDKDFREGVADKRLLVVEAEFASVLARGKRDGNPLAQTMRDAWDGTRLSTIVRKQNRLIATGHHISVIGHITAAELRFKLADSDVAGGSMNRFLTVCSKRSKRLPDGGGAPEQVVDALAAELRQRVEHSRTFRRIERDTEAQQLWRDAYEALTPDVAIEGHYAAVVARAVPQVLRLSLTFALLDEQEGPSVIRAEHLRAAIAVWDYAQASAWFVFGDVAANVDLTRLCEAVDKADGHSLTRTEIYSTVFGSNKKAAAIEELIRQAVATGGYVTSTQTDLPGPPIRRLTTRARGHVLDALDVLTPSNSPANTSNASNTLPRDKDDRLSSSISYKQCALCPDGIPDPGRGICPACDDRTRSAS